ncbi:type VI secretion system tube protein Hcp [Roseateles sp.]|uniref:type VI secretion system tube protein Hcp n=1 Tax=Roseateles sp. TaxID=1971397 RepID=UPI0025DAA837|nr:type VI secretion system tube protein Hcp [Roseateles sp.]MBV8034266.1 type VI secretion system tube protein Hcp [Roseateles sp.]
MDLILFQPGDSGVFAGPNSFSQGGSLIDGKKWMGDSIKLGPCIELVSVHNGMKQQVTTDVSTSARTSGRPVITELTYVKYVDKTSVKMYEYCLRAQPLGVSDKNPPFLCILRNSGDNTSLSRISMSKMSGSHAEHGDCGAAGARKRRTRCAFPGSGHACVVHNAPNAHS